MSKTPILLFVLSVISGPVHAQTTKGSMMAGGSFEIRSESYDPADQNNFSSFTLSPSLGYFINDNLAVGASLGVGTSRRGTGPGKTVNTNFSFGPFARYYMFTASDQFAFFGQAGLTFGAGKTDPPSGNVVRDRWISFALSPGAAYFINSHWALELSFRGFYVTSHNWDTEGPEDKSTSAGFGINSLSPSLGIRYHF